jgi:hypothetical protein
MSTYGGAFLNGFMVMLHGLRGDLGEHFQLSTKLGRTAFLIWFLHYGNKEFGIPQKFLPDLNWADMQAHSFCSEVDRPVTSLLIAALWLAYPICKNELSLYRDEDIPRIEMAIAAWPDKPDTMPALRLSDETHRQASMPDPQLPGDTQVPITYLMRSVWMVRRDLQGAFPLDSARSRKDYVSWFLTKGKIELDLGLFPQIDQSVSAPATVTVEKKQKLSWMLPNRSR